MIDQEKAKELAIEYIKKENPQDPPSFNNIRVCESGNEWSVFFKKILSKNTIEFPNEYCIKINKETGEARWFPLK